MRAFTLLELVIVLIIMGLLTLIALPKLAPNAQRLGGAADILRTHIRYVQMRAQSYGQQFGLTNSSNIGYFMFKEDTGSQMVLPGSSGVYTLKDSITISNFTVSFDSWGTPCSDQAGTTPITQDIVITLHDGIESKTVRINVGTGFVE